MELQNKRVFKAPDYTIGKFYIDGVLTCDILEDKVRDINNDGDLDDPGEAKVFGETAIPSGRYRVVLSYSPKFKRILPEILDVKGFTAIRMHRGRTAIHSHGCLLTGINKVKGQVLEGEKYEKLIVAELQKAVDRKEEIWITIT